MSRGRAMAQPIKPSSGRGLELVMLALEFFGKVKGMKKRYLIGGGSIATATALIMLFREARPLVETYATPMVMTKAIGAEKKATEALDKTLQMERNIKDLRADLKSAHRKEMELLKGLARPGTSIPEPEAFTPPEHEEGDDHE